MVNINKVNAFLSALADKFENKQQNKKSDISGDFSEDTVSYPTVQGVKTWVNGLLAGKSNTGHGHTKSEISDFPVGVSSFTNDAGYLTSHQSLNGYVQSSDLHQVATTGSYEDLEDKPDLSDFGGVVSVVEQGTADTGYAKTYVVKQNNNQVGAKINIPKDFLVKSGSVKTVTTANSPVTGYQVGDKYIDFVINAKDNSGTDEHMYILVSDLVEDTTYTADGSTLQLVNGQFSVKNGGINTTQLASAVNTSLGYANNWNSSPAKSITSTDITNWNGKSNITTADIDSEIDAYLDAMITALS